MVNLTFHERLKKIMDEYAQTAYALTNKFPRDEIYGIISQLRRAALSVILNYVEGYARRKLKVKLNFFEISYASLKETKYLLYFSLKQNYIEHDEYKKAIGIADEIGAMLWRTIQGIEKECN